MTDYVRRLVSGNKARFKDGKLNLELGLVVLSLFGVHYLTFQYAFMALQIWSTLQIRVRYLTFSPAGWHLEVLRQ